MAWLRDLIDRLLDRGNPVREAPISTETPEFRGGFGKALAEHGEAQVLVRHRDGSRQHYLFRKGSDFEAFLLQLSAGDGVTVSLAKPYPLRGTMVNLEEMLDWFKGNNIEIALLPAAEGEIEVEVLEPEDLVETESRLIAVGPAVPYWLPNGEVAVTAYVPNSDGSLTTQN